MGYLSTDKKKITTKTFAEMKKAGEKVTMLTAYDFTTAGIIDAAGIDSILIGDSASNVMAGNADTLPITVDQMIYHARSVARACQHAFVVCDMPFGSYQISKMCIRDRRSSMLFVVSLRIASEVRSTSFNTSWALALAMLRVSANNNIMYLIFLKLLIINSF